MYIRASTASDANTPTQQKLVIDGLTYQPSTYYYLRLINETTGQYYDVSNNGGGSSPNYYSIAYTFSVSPNTTNRYRAEAKWQSQANLTTVYNTLTSPQASVPIGTVTGLFDYNTLKDAFSVSWNSASGASSYEVQRRLDGTSSWSTFYTTSTYYNFSGLTPETYYEVRVRGYSGSSYGSYSSTILVRTQSNKPSPLAWSYRSSGQNFNVTANEWNDMTSKINAWRIYQNPSASSISFQVAYSGNNLTASMFNQAVNAITALNPPYLPAATVSVGETVTAAKINRISDSLDSLI